MTLPWGAEGQQNPRQSAKPIGRCGAMSRTEGVRAPGWDREGLTPVHLRGKLLVRAGLAGAVLLATIGGMRLVRSAEERRVSSLIADAVAVTERRLEEAVTAHLTALESRAQNAGTNPRLVAALGGKVDLRTLRELFQHEPWWQPFRQVFRSYYLAHGADRPVHILGTSVLGKVDAGPLVRRVRESGRPASRVYAVEGWPQAVVAVPVELPSAVWAPVLLLVQPLDAAALGVMAERLEEAVLLSDGRRALLGSGPTRQTAVVKRAVGHEGDGMQFAPEPRRWAVAVSPVADGLWLLGHVATAGLAAAAAGPFMVWQIVIAAVGTVLFLTALLALRRSHRNGSAVSPGEAVLAGAGGAGAAAAAAAAAAAGAGSAVGSVGRYVLLQKLGGGGMAEVHLAVSLGESGFRRPCVVKRLRSELARNPLAVEQFTDEATLASSLVHANIVPIYDFGRVGDQYFLVQEYVVGRDLGRVVRKLVERKRALPPDALAFVAAEVLKALEYAHNRRGHDGGPTGIVHRDVSPENIMVSLRGEVRLLDFGVLTTADKKATKTNDGALKGNLAFMAPEQARGLDVDARADLYSLGLVLYFALTGESLYQADPGYDLLMKAAAGVGPAELPKLDRLPAPFPAVLRRALAARRDDRYPSAAAFAAELGAGAGAGGAPGRLPALMAELFEEELRLEQQQLATQSSSIRPRATPAVQLIYKDLTDATAAGTGPGMEGTK